MPFTFSALPIVLTGYVISRLRGRFGRDIPLVILLLAALALAFYVTALVMGDITVVRCTVIFLIFRLLWQLR